MDAKTGTICAVATAPDVKTEKPPYVRRVQGKYWYFMRGDLNCRLIGEPGDDDFTAHYNELCRISGVPGIAIVDTRKVYFMGWEGGPIKIGLADDVKIRRDTLQVACPYPLLVLAVTDGGIARELEYHRQFSAWRMRGEWFERTPEIEAEIERLSQ